MLGKALYGKNLGVRHITSLQKKVQACLSRDGSWWFISTEDLLPPWATIQGQGSPENSASMLCTLQLLKIPS